MTQEAESRSQATKFEEEWTHSADAAASAHQIRNRLQSIIIEAALLKRVSGGDLAALNRIASLAQDGAGHLEVFGELIRRPQLEGKTQLDVISTIAAENDVETEFGAETTWLGFRAEALIVLVRLLLTKAIPFRGFTATRISVASVGEDRVEVLVELQPSKPVQFTSMVTPWMTALQMARDVGGSLELHSGEPPLVKLRFPRG